MNQQDSSKNSSHITSDDHYRLPNLVKRKVRNLVTVMGLWSNTIKSLGLTRAIRAWIKKHSFSTVKKNAFKFGLEAVIFAVAIASVSVNTFGEPGKFTSSYNELEKYLSEHPERNEYIASLMQTENITVSPIKEHFILAAQAATIDPYVTAVAENSMTEEENTPQILLTSSDGALLKPNYAATDAVQKKTIEEYTVQPGDSIGKISRDFGVSVPTILKENNITDADYIRPGQVLRILPTTGLKHTVAEGETMAGIAKKYEVDLEAILEYNGIEIIDDIYPGETLIIPDGRIELPRPEPSTIASYNRVDVQRAALPDDFQAAGGDFLWPLGTRNVTQYYWSRHRALDISNGQRPQFWASEAGVVELSGWQGDYGRTVVINHGNGYKSRYAHASELYVSAGDKVERGQVIGRVGNTGRSYGKTGNHLHFELTKDGVKVNPVPYLD